jgi:hypothetical protein
MTKKWTTPSTTHPPPHRKLAQVPFDFWLKINGIYFNTSVDLYARIKDGAVSGGTAPPLESMTNSEFTYPGPPGCSPVEALCMQDTGVAWHKGYEQSVHGPNLFLYIRPGDTR